MNNFPEEIAVFLKQNKVATVCFTDEKGAPYCINCFFVFDEPRQLFVFKSSFGAFHEDFVRDVAAVAGSVLPEKLDPLKIKGMQFTGQTLSENEVNVMGLSGLYYQKFPFGRVMPGYIWALRADFIKFTDNTLGFGTKLNWRRIPATEGV
jgi:uncharacterized protein